MTRSPPFTDNHKSSPRTIQLRGVAEQLRFGSGYSPAVGQEDCPKCWTSHKATNRLRTEPHHNGVGVFFVVCDACGFYLVL